MRRWFLATGGKIRLLTSRLFFLSFSDFLLNKQDIEREPALFGGSLDFERHPLFQ